MTANLRQAVEDMEALEEEFSTCLYVAVDDVRDLGVELDLNAIFASDLPGNLGEHPREIRRARRLIVRAMLERVLLGVDVTDPYVNIEVVRPLAPARPDEPTILSHDEIETALRKVPDLDLSMDQFDALARSVGGAIDSKCTDVTP